MSVAIMAQVKTQLMGMLNWFQQEDIDSYPSYVRIETPVPDVDMLRLLAAQNQHSVLSYWADRNGTDEIAGIGQADTYMQDQQLVLSQLALHVSTCLKDAATLVFEGDKPLLKAGASQARFLGGVQFSDRVTKADEWSSFGTAQFVLPQIEFNRVNDQTSAVLNIVFDQDDRKQILQDLQTTIDQLADSHTVDHSLPTIQHTHLEPNEEQWTRLFHMVKRQMEQGAFQKIVLARRQSLQLSAMPNPFVMLEQFRHHPTPSFSFCFQFQPGHAFLGYSPELLFRVNDQRLYSEAVAGTRHRGATSDEDQQLASELMQSAKDRVEHQYVSDQIRQAFRQWCDHTEKDSSITVLKTPKVQHLYQEFNGHLKPGIQDVDVLSGLHPTSAVCGLPKELMRSYITQHEPFERGWYAGAVGCIGLDKSDFSVAIRSALCDGDNIHLYSGVGLVEDSCCESEWQEMNHKLELFLELFQ